MRIPRNSQQASGIRNLSLGSPPNGGIPPQRRRHGGPPPSASRSSKTDQPEASDFWDIGDWAHNVAPGQTPRSQARGRTASPSDARGKLPTRQGERSSTKQEGALNNVPGAFPQDHETAKPFQLVTAPARARAPEAPSHGDNGFWAGESREHRQRRQDEEDGRERREREDKRERYEREERRERDRCEREERRERDRLEREDRRERQEREDRRERREREDRRDGL